MHLVDVSGSEGRDPVEDFDAINAELREYSPELAERPQIVVGNKCDLPGADVSSMFLREAAEADGRPYFEVSAVTGAGIEELVTACAAQVAELRKQIEVDAPTVDFNAPVERARLRRDQKINVTREERHVWRVSGGAIERMVVQTDWDNDEAVSYLQRRFDRIGLDDLLAKSGCVQGDEVRILGFEFSYDGDKKQEAVSPEEDDLTDDDALLDEDAFGMGEDD